MPADDRDSSGPSTSSALSPDIEKQALLLERRTSKTIRTAVSHAPKEAFHQLVHSWFSRKFATGCAILLPIVVTFYITYHFLQLFDGIFSPLYKHFFGFEVFGLGFLTSVVSGALNPDAGDGKAFQEAVIVRHPRHGEYAIAFVTGRTVLQTHEGDMRLTAVFVPTNHVYVGDIFLLDDRDIIRTNLTVREGLEIVVSVGMALPPTLSAISRRL